MSKKINNILLIDDDAVNNFIVINTLKRLDIADKITAATNGLEAIDLIKSYISDNQNDLPKIIFLDINMPIMDGWEFLEEFEKLDSEIKSQIYIYMVSSSVYEDDISRSKTYQSVTDFISKPLIQEKILEIYRNHI